MPFRELAEALAGLGVRPDRLLLGVRRVGGDLLCDSPDLLRERVPVPRVVQQGVHPGLRAIVRRVVVVEEELAQEEADADVRERPERQQTARRMLETAELPGLLPTICAQS